MPDEREGPYLHYLITDEMEDGYKILLPTHGEEEQLRNMEPGKSYEIDTKEMGIAYYADDSALAHDLFATAFMNHFQQQWGQPDNPLEFIGFFSRRYWDLYGK